MKMKEITGLNELVGKLSERKTLILLQTRLHHFSGEHGAESEVDPYLPQVINNIGILIEPTII